MNKMNIKNKKAAGEMWWILVFAVVAIIVAGIVLYITQGGLFAGKQNVDALTSCENQGGECKTKDDCGPDSTKFFKFGGCPNNPDKTNKYCCIPK